MGLCARNPQRHLPRRASAEALTCSQGVTSSGFAPVLFNSFLELGRLGVSQRYSGSGSCDAVPDLLDSISRAATGKRWVPRDLMDGFM